MKFLVIGKGIDYGGPINPADFAMFSEYVILPSIAMVKDWEDKGKVDFTLTFSASPLIV